MDNGFLNSLQLYQTQNMSGLVDENMLSKALVTSPHEISTMLSYIMGNLDRQYSNTIDAITNGLGRVETVENREYSWKVMMESDHAVEIIKAEWNGSTLDSTSSTQTPGIDLTTIKVTVPERYFGVGTIVAFDDRDFQARVQSEPYQDGGNWVYSLVVADGDPSTYIPPAQFAAGSKLSRDFSAYEEYSDEDDIVSYQTPVELKNHLTTLRLGVPVTGSASKLKAVIKFKDPKTGRESALWSDMAYWNAIRQWYKMKETQLLYSKYNANAQGQTELVGSNGRPVYIGAGLLDQISPSHSRNYTSMSLDLVDDFLFDLSYNKLAEGQRKFVALGGEMATRELDRVLKDKASGYNLQDTKFVTGSGQDLTFGGQFTTYKGVNGIELTIRHLPAFDNAERNRKKHPVSGRPLESYRMVFLDYGMRDGASNVRKVVRKDRENLQWYVCGSTVPDAVPDSSIVRSSGIDGYNIKWLSEEGIKIEDPSTTGQLICTAE